MKAGARAAARLLSRWGPEPPETPSCPARAFWDRPAGRPPLLVGHRGARGPAPENTLGAFAHAVALGARAVELDVRTCRSGEVVVHHDPTLARLTADRDARRVADLPWSELSRVRLGAGEGVPRLADVLERLRPEGIGVNVEMKHDVPDRGAVVRAVARLLLAWDVAHPIVVSSFDPRMIMALAEIAPGVPRALLVNRSRHDFAMLAAAGPLHGRSLRPVRVDAVHLDRALATPRRVDALRRRGLRVFVWTVNDPDEARRLDAMGVAGIISDVPGALA